MEMKFESDDIKRGYLRAIAKTCAQLFGASSYPDQVFDFPFTGVPEKLAYPILELHIRMPAMHCLPVALKPPIGVLPSKGELLTILRNCPAIESIHLRPEFQRFGFLNALMNALAGQGIPYVNISNIKNEAFALHYLSLSQGLRSGVELTSQQNTVTPSICYPTFSINLRERYAS